MILAAVQKRHKTELMCDMAEVYHIFDYRGMPAFFVAELVAGLSTDSRVKMAISGQQIDKETALLACILDGINTLVWQNTKDAQKGRNKPQSVYLAMTQTKEKDTLRGFRTSAEFEAYRKSLLEV